MSFLRKHAAPAAALFCALFAFAAPYLIPANPDSAFFRGGVWGALLVAACLYPVWQALRRAEPRELLCGMGWALLFSLALSLGSELFIYNGLLRGMGSLLRRIAVPLMAAPALGALSARLFSAKPRETQALRFPLWGYALVILLGWLPVWLAFFPGMINYDFPAQYQQHIDHAYSSLHPLLHSALSNGLMALGEAFSSPTLGLLLNTVLQMLVFSFALAYSCAFVQKRGAPAWALAAMTAAYALLPIFSTMALSTCKDTLFSAALLVLSLQAFELLEAPEAFFRKIGLRPLSLPSKSVKTQASPVHAANPSQFPVKQRKTTLFLFLLCVVGTALLRNNGLFAFALLIPALLIAARGWRRQTALLLAACLCAAGMVNGGLTLLLHPSRENTSFQLYSIPAQQLVRAYNSGTMSDADKEEIRSWYVSDEGLAVYPHLADPAKGYLDRERIQRSGGDFLALWQKHVKTHAHEYLEAFLMLNVGSWYPDDLSQSTIYPDVSYNDKGYLQLQETDMRAYGIETACFLPAVRDLFEQICRRNSYQKYPLVSLLFAVATPFWLILFACAKLISGRRARMLPAALGALGVWLSYLFGPCTLPRYALPLFCLAPALLILSFLPPYCERSSGLCTF